MNSPTRLALIALLVIGVIAALILLARPLSLVGNNDATQAPTWPAETASPAQAASSATPEAWETAGPLVPTLVATTLPSPTITQTAAMTLTPELVAAGLPLSPTLPAPPLPSVTPAATALATPAAAEQAGLRNRLGVGVPLNVTTFQFDEALARQLGMGWYLDWKTEVQPVQTDGLEFAQMVRVRGTHYTPSRSQLVQVLAENPGALWLIGNEPDVQWQDNTSPEQYAVLYQELYTFIKALDPSAQVAIGAISQVTPLRLSYLERVLAEYERRYGRPMPVDVWNTHAFVLREERDSWGVSIPPGFDDVNQGMLWEIEDHDDLALFRQQIIDFRRWMDQHGQRNKPLIVSEYGILMPAEYGFPSEDVAKFMTGTFDYLLNASDPELGYPADGNRLVQRLAWYSLSDTTYPTGNLVEPKTGELTLLGQTFADYSAGLEPLP